MAKIVFFMAEEIYGMLLLTAAATNIFKGR